MRSDELDRLVRKIGGASRGPALPYAQVLERAIAVCAGDPDAAAYLEGSGRKYKKCCGAPGGEEPLP